MSTIPSNNTHDDLDFGPTLRGLRPGWKVFRHYTLRRELGRGGMGVVWLTHDEKLDLEVALKFLPEKLAHDEAAIDDLRRETRRCIKLNHPNIVRVYGLLGGDDEADSTVAIAMEFVEGKSLTGLRLEKESRVFEPAEIMPWVRQVCEALAYAHDEGRVVHRDLKPANLMVDARGNVRVMDFGIASSLSDSMSRVSKAAQSTAGGGTLPYMSPQQLMGAPPSVSDDVYSLGATLYELLTGKPPFFRGGEAGITRQIETALPPSMAERRGELGVEHAAPIPQAWEQTVAACLEKEAEKRPQSVAEVWQRLGRDTGSAHGSADTPVRGSKMEQAEAAKPRSEPALSPLNKPALELEQKQVSAVQSKVRKPLIVSAVVAIAALASLAIWEMRPASLPIYSPPGTEGSTSDVMQATRSKTFENTLGMKFVPVPITGGPTDGKRVLFSIWDTRVKDYAAYAAEKSGVDAGWKDPFSLNGFKQTENDPVVCVSWEDAKAFCEWLTAKERAAGLLSAGWSYRLPSDHEWSCAVGIGGREDASASQRDKNAKIEDEYPWGTQWPPPKGVGNYADETAKKAGSGNVYMAYIDGYEDGFAYTSPMGSFAPNKMGLYDMGGNVWQWCEECYDSDREFLMITRGASWDGSCGLRAALSSYRSDLNGSFRGESIGFRCVLAMEEKTSETVGFPASSKAVAGGSTGTDLMSPVAGGDRGIEAVTKEKPYENTLGMKFVPVPITGGPSSGQKVLFSIWDTRVKDYAAYAAEKSNLDDSWKEPFQYTKQTIDDPVVTVSWEEAKAFCEWLTKKERAAGRLPSGWSYRLPSDHEWSCAVGIGQREDASKDPSDKSMKIEDEYPWGVEWPPPKGAGNYDERLKVDPELHTSPVGSFAANALGLYDMGGNVFQWCEDWYDHEKKYRVQRGVSFVYETREYLLSSFRYGATPGYRSVDCGFRCVVAVSSPP